jgi:hypothetical protein
VGQAGEPQLGPPDPAREPGSVAEEPLGLPERAIPPICQARHASAHTSSPQAGLRSLCRVLLPLGLLGDRGQVAALAGQQQPGDPEQQVSLSATGARRRRHATLG